MIADIVLVFVCMALLGASAFFSGSETALFALSSRQRHVVSRRHDLPSRRVATLLGELGDVLITVLVGNNFVNILLAVLAARLFIRHLGPETGALYSVVVVTLAILLFGEILPKSLAVRHPLDTSTRVAAPLLRVHGLLDPVAAPLKRFNRRVGEALMRILPGDNLEMREEDLLALFSLGVEDGSIAHKERELVRGVFELGETPLREAMTPRVDLFLLEADTPAQEAADRVRKAGYSHVPLMRGDPDHVVGVLEATVLLPRDGESVAVQELARDPRFCPESQMAGSLLLELMQEDEPLALVLDEYGALAGLVTLEDLFEVLVGEIVNQRDFESRRLFMPDESILIASSRMELERVEELLGVTLSSEHAETLGGYLMEALGEVPEAGRTYRLGTLAWTVLDADGPALKTLKLERLP